MALGGGPEEKQGPRIEALVLDVEAVPRAELDEALALRMPDRPRMSSGDPKARAAYELYAYVPYEAPAEIANQLRELQRELDSEQMRTQLIIALDPSSEIRAGGRADLWFDTERIHVFDPATGENLTASPTPVMA